jgi:hypothetical protein
MIPGAGNTAVGVVTLTATRCKERGAQMRAGIFFTGTGPILVLTTYDSLADAKIVEKLAAKGIKKFIACEVPEHKVKEKYGTYFDVIMGDLYQSDDLRVLDYDGHNVFYNFSFSDLGEPIYHEPEFPVNG